MEPDERHLDWLRSYKGVRHLAEMDPNVTEAVRLSEESIKTQAGMEYINEGYSEALERDVRLCLFCDTTFPTPKNRMYLKCSDGTILGRSLQGCELEQFACREDVIWIAEDFVLFPNAMGTGHERFVLAPIPFEPFNEVGGKESILTIPASTTDVLLRNHYGMPDTREIASIILAYNFS